METREKYKKYMSNNILRLAFKWHALAYSPSLAKFKIVFETLLFVLAGKIKFSNVNGYCVCHRVLHVFQNKTNFFESSSARDSPEKQSTEVALKSAVHSFSVCVFAHRWLATILTLFWGGC